MTAPTPQQIAERVAAEVCPCAYLGQRHDPEIDIACEHTLAIVRKVLASEQLAALWPQPETSERLAQAWDEGCDTACKVLGNPWIWFRPYRQPVPADTDGGE